MQNIIIVSYKINKRLINFYKNIVVIRFQLPLLIFIVYYNMYNKHYRSIFNNYKINNNCIFTTNYIWSTTTYTTYYYNPQFDNFKFNSDYNYAGTTNKTRYSILFFLLIPILYTTAYAPAVYHDTQTYSI